MQPCGIYLQEWYFEKGTGTLKEFVPFKTKHAMSAVDFVSNTFFEVKD